MALSSFLPMLVFGGLFVGLFVWMMKKRATAVAGAPQAVSAFLQQTGYRVAALPPNAPLEEHVRLAVESMNTMGGAQGTEWIRDVGGVPVRHFYRTLLEGQQTIYWCRWYLPTGRPPRVGIQIVDKGLIGLRGAAARFLQNSRYDWTQMYPDAGEVGDRDLDARFKFFATDPHALRGVVSAPGLRDLLLACTVVDIRIDQKAILFTDAFRVNLSEAIGGGMAILAGGADWNKMLAAQVPVHERISMVVATLARSCL